MELATLREACFAQTKDALQTAVTADQLVIQAHEMMHDLHISTNNLAKRLREWSGGWLPELDTLKDHEHVIDLLASQDAKGILKELGRSGSIGTPLAAVDSKQIQAVAKQLQALYKQKKDLLEYMDEKLAKIMPSTQALCGTSITAELLSHAGSLKKLARYPAGTIQLLGAETALFRHLKNKKNKPPKHGMIFNHQIVQRAQRKDRGKVARALADKIALCARVDYFEGEPIGEKYRKGLEQRFGQ
jgi:nucleolar protein 56